MVEMTVVERLVKAFAEKFGREPEIISSAPGRLDFLNTHQDYKGLPVVSIAINKRTYVAVSKRADNMARVFSLNLCEEGTACQDSFDASKPSLLEKGWFGNYIRSVTKALLDYGVDIKGFDLAILSEIPVASGLASSAALQVATVNALLTLHGLNLPPGEIAELAYRSEHDIMGIPCGRLDQYGSSFGGIAVIETRPPYKTRVINKAWFKLVAVNSGIKHSTGAIHPIRIAEIEKGLTDLLSLPDLPPRIRSLIGKSVYETKWEELSLEELASFLERIEENPGKRIVFTLKMHLSTTLALRLLEDKSSKVASEVISLIEKECPRCIDEASKASTTELLALGAIVNYQHALLRDLYDVSLPELEAIREKALEAGAIGVKISGAGLGGALLALVEDERNGVKVVEKVISNAKGAWLVEIDEGARIDWRSPSTR